MSEAKIVDFWKNEAVAYAEGVKKTAVDGESFTKSTTFFDHSSGNFRAGHWSATKGAWEHNHPMLPRQLKESKSLFCWSRTS